MRLPWFCTCSIYNPVTAYELAVWMTLPVTTAGALAPLPLSPLTKTDRNEPAPRQRAAMVYLPVQRVARELVEKSWKFQPELLPTLPKHLGCKSREPGPRNYLCSLEDHPRRSEQMSSSSYQSPASSAYASESDKRIRHGPYQDACVIKRTLLRWCFCRPHGAIAFHCNRFQITLPRHGLALCF